MRDDLRDLALGHSVVERPLEMSAELFGPIRGDEGGHDGHDAVALAESRPLSNVAIYDGLRQLNHLRDRATDAFTRRRGSNSHRVFSVLAKLGERPAYEKQDCTARYEWPFPGSGLSPLTD
jgi:hypothetical protein